MECIEICMEIMHRYNAYKSAFKSAWMECIEICMEKRPMFCRMANYFFSSIEIIILW
jgi:hypothetical protein